MARFAPFEDPPIVAVGLSGGADSLSLTHLAAHWAEDRNGHAIALTVDHGLRTESAEEAASVAEWMAQAGIAHHIVAARAAGLDLAQGNVQASARSGRLRLLEDWCRKAGILHLLLAHHQEDQAETVLQRLARGSGVHGLAAMTPEKNFRYVRILRPLLDQPKARLEATLQSQGLRWIDDPSNRDRHYDRVRLRQAMAAINADDRLINDRLAHTAGAMRRTRHILDDEIDRLLAGALSFSPLGYGVLDAQALAGADRDLAARALGLVIATVGAAPHPPRREAVLRWLDLIVSQADGGATLMGAQLTRWHTRWLIHRELAAVAPPVTLRPGESARWDGRFHCALAAKARQSVEICALRALPAEDRRSCLRSDKVPSPVESTLPAIRILDGPCFVPHLNAGRGADSAVYLPLNVTFSPDRPLTDPVSPGVRIEFGVSDSGLKISGSSGNGA